MAMIERLFRAGFSKSLFPLIVGALIAVVAASAQAAGSTAKILDPNNKKDVLFLYKHESVDEGDKRLVTNTFTSPDGKVAAIETAEFVKAGNGERLRVYKMSQKQLGAEGSVEVKDGTAHFSYTRDGKTKTSTEKVGDDFVVGPSVVSYLQKHWKAIQKGDTVKARFAVLDRLETVGFEYFKDKETEVGGQKAYDIKMKPSSFIIAALVKPLHFFMAPDGSRLLELHGRTQVKRKDGSSWKDLDAVTVYEY